MNSQSNVYGYVVSKPFKDREKIHLGIIKSYDLCSFK